LETGQLEQIYEGVTVRLAPNDEESATITFNTGVAQGIITSPQLSNIFNNALLRMLMVTGQNKDLVTGCRLERIRKETTSEMKMVINSTT